MPKKFKGIPVAEKHPKSANQLVETETYNELQISPFKVNIGLKSSQKLKGGSYFAKFDRTNTMRIVIQEHEM